MTINSMTAFSQREHSDSWGTVSWEIKTVNHRYLDLSFKLPERFRALEPQLRDGARKALARGKLDAQLRYDLDTDQQAGLRVDKAQLQSLNQTLDVIAAARPDAAPATTLDILAWPGVLEPAATDDTAVRQAVLALFDTAITEIGENRAREGAALASFITQRVGELHTTTAGVQARLPQVLAELESRLRARLAELAIDTDANRLEQEIVLLAQKADVSEELDRLNTHCDEIERVLKKGGSCGRRLDFLMQELNREANTLGSKSIAGDISRTTVDMKVLIEQMREQIQNIE